MQFVQPENGLTFCQVHFHIETFLFQTVLSDNFSFSVTTPGSIPQIVFTFQASQLITNIQ